LYEWEPTHREEPLEPRQRAEGGQGGQQGRQGRGTGSARCGAAAWPAGAAAARAFTGGAPSSRPGRARRLHICAPLLLPQLPLLLLPPPRGAL